MRRLAIVAAVSSPNALNTMAFSANRAPDRNSRSLQLAARLEVLVASECGDHPLANLVALASALDKSAGRRVRPRSCGESTCAAPCAGAHRVSRAS
jgi:hypothetical protein